MIKIFGIGNPLLKDDGIGITVAKVIKQIYETETYIAEIFVEDALETIVEEDYIIIIDAVQLGKPIGEVQIISFEEYLKILTPYMFCHNRNLLDTLLISYPKIKGELIGIEINRIEYGEGLSAELEERLDDIIGQIRIRIEQLIRKEDVDA